MKRIVDQKVIPAVSSMKEVEQFLDSPLEICILLDLHLSLVEGIIKQIHQKGKSALVHLDLVRGISTDEYGCEYVVQRLKADGIISTKSKVIETAKKNHCIAIQRMFLIDSKSLEKGIATINASKPDFVEILPGLACQVFPQIQLRLNCKLLGGGLLKTHEQIYDCLRNGASAVTISSLTLAEEFHLEQKL